MLSETTRLITEHQAVVSLTIANILYVICYGVRDILWLRVFCVFALCMILPYYIWGTESAQMSCIYWNLIFLVINLYWIVVIFRERQPPVMTDQQKHLYEEVFKRSCSPQAMLQLLAISQDMQALPGQAIINKATTPNALLLINSGIVNVVVDNKMITTLTRGDFMGEMSFLTGEAAVADVIAASATRYLRWDRADLEKLFDRRPELKSVVNELIGRDLVQKLVSSENKVPELSVDSLCLD